MISISTDLYKYTQFRGRTEDNFPGLYGKASSVQVDGNKRIEEAERQADREPTAKEKVIELTTTFFEEVVGIPNITVVDHKIDKGDIRKNKNVGVPYGPLKDKYKLNNINHITSITSNKLKPMTKTYKFYDKRGRRLAIFGKQEGTTTMNVVVIPCSTTEKNFSKKRANELYENLLKGEKVAHEAYSVLIVDNKPGQSLINWCRKNFYYHVDMITSVTYPILITDGKYPIGKKVVVHFDFIEPTD